MTLIAMIDDEPLVRESVGKLLQIRGYKTFCFDSAETFLSSPKHSTVDCIVADYRLPGMNGCEMLRQLRAQNILTPALLFSGNIDESILSMLEGISKVTPLAKPCLSADLYAAVDACMNPDV